MLLSSLWQREAKRLRNAQTLDLSTVPEFSTIQVQVPLQVNSWVKFELSRTGRIKIFSLSSASWGHFKGDRILFQGPTFICMRKTEFNRSLPLPPGTSSREVSPEKENSQPLWADSSSALSSSPWRSCFAYSYAPVYGHFPLSYPTDH